MALDFDGVDQYVSCGDVNFLGADGSFSWCFWLYLNSLTTEKTILGKSTANNANNDPWFMIYVASLKCLLIWETANAFQNPGIQDTALTVGAWYHMIATYNGTNRVDYFRNGVADGGGAVAADPPDTAESFLIGARNWGGIAMEIDGIIDDARCYNRQLSAAEAKIIYSARGNDNIVNGLVARWLMNEKADGVVAAGANTVIDISGNGNHGTPVNEPVYRGAPVKLIKPIIIV